MSDNNSLNVNAGKPKIGGAVFRAPVGTTLPESVSATLSSAFENLGFISDAGVVNSNSPSNTSIKEWGGATVLDIQTEKPDTFKMAFLESTNLEVLKTIYGDDNVTGDLETGAKVEVNADEPPVQSMVIDMVLKNEGAKRVVLPRCKVTSVSDITYAGSDAVKYEVTLSCYPDDSGNTHIEYIKGGTVVSL